MENREKVSLPADFDGVFRFTNPTKEAFTGKWNGRAYTYPPLSTSPMVILDATPLEIQHIRKKFAKELAEREFFKGEKYESLRSVEGHKDANGVMKPLLGPSLQGARSYTNEDLTSLIQKCLEPLPVAKAEIEEIPKEPIEQKLTRNKRGKPNTRAIQEDESLVEKALSGTLE